MAEDGIGGFCLGHKFDDTPSELRAGLHCIGKLGEYQDPYRAGYGPPYDTVYDIIGYAGNGLHVHVLRLHPGFRNNLMLDGTISAVSTDNPELSTPRGLRCGDLPRRAWEIYGKADAALYGPTVLFPQFVLFMRIKSFLCGVILSILMVCRRVGLRCPRFGRNIKTVKPPQSSASRGRVFSRSLFCGGLTTRL